MTDRGINLVVDGFNLLYRAHHSTGNLTLADGRLCGAAWGFLRMLLAAAKDVSAATRRRIEHVHVVWDGGRSPRRLALHPDYKAWRGAGMTSEERKARHEALNSQRDMLSGCLALLGASEYRADEVEADDVAALLAQALQPAVIFSGDHDFLQLVRDDVSLLRGDALLRPGQVDPDVELLRLVVCGDQSDCIPGVRYFGDKSLEKLVVEMRIAGFPATPFGLIAAVNSESLPEPLLKPVLKLRAHVDVIRRNLSMVNLQESSKWPEVEAAATSPVTAGSGVLNASDLHRRLSEMGWFSLRKSLSAAAAAFAGEGGRWNPL